jgi:hypothetical protein
MTWVLFFLVGLTGGSAQFASQEMCVVAGKELKEKFSAPPDGSAGVRVEYFCISSGFKVPD